MTGAWSAPPGCEIRLRAGVKRMPLATSKGLRSPAALAEVPAVILCGGLGTRLRPVVPDRPKGLALVGGRPFLEYLFGWLRGAGIHDLILCTGYASEAIREHFGTGGPCGLSLRYSEEAVPLGTGGALRGAEHLISKGTFLVLNGDSIVDVDLERLLIDHLRRKSAATMTLALAPQPERYGQVSIGEQQEVLAFAEKEAAGASGPARASRYINGGVYAFQREALALIPPAPPAVSLERSVLPRLIGNGLRGFRSEGYFIDIGVPEDFRRAQEELPRRLGYVHAHPR